MIFKLILLSLFAIAVLALTAYVHHCETLEQRLRERKELSLARYRDDMRRVEEEYARYRAHRNFDHHDNRSK